MQQEVSSAQKVIHEMRYPVNTLHGLSSLASDILILVIFAGCQVSEAPAISEPAVAARTDEAPGADVVPKVPHQATHNSEVSSIALEIK